MREERGKEDIEKERKEETRREVSRKLVSVKHNRSGKMWAKMCPLDFATSRLVILEKAVSEIQWGWKQH